MLKVPMYAKTTDIGVATTKTLLNGGVNVKMPDWARCLHAVAPQLVTDVLDVDLSHAAMISFESKDLAIEPYELICNPIAGNDATSGQPYHAPIEKFLMNCPLEGGEDISVYGTPLQAVTGPLYVGCTLIVSDLKLGRQRFAKVGTITETGAAAAEVKATAYTLSACHRIVEVYGMVMSEIHAAANMITGFYTLKSGAFKVPVPLEYGCEPISGALGTIDGPYLSGISREKVKVLTNATVKIQDYMTFDLAPTVHGFFLTGVAFEKIGRN